MYRHSFNSVKRLFQTCVLYGEELMIIIYLGWVGLCLAGFGIWKERRKEDWKLWVLFGLHFLCLLFGTLFTCWWRVLVVEWKENTIAIFGVV